MEELCWKRIVLLVFVPSQLAYTRSGFQITEASKQVTLTEKATWHASRSQAAAMVLAGHITGP